MPSYLKPRRGYYSSISSTVLQSGEVFFETPNGIGGGEGKIMMGDGSSTYESLASAGKYFMDMAELKSRLEPRCILRDNKDTITSDYGFTYDDLSDMLANGTWKGIIKDGDYIELTTRDNYTYKMYFNINAYQQYTREGQHPQEAQIVPHIDMISTPHIDMISDCLIPISTKMRSTDTNNGTESQPNPFMASDTIQTFLNNYLNQIPSTLESHIVDKVIKGPMRYQSGSSLTNDNGYTDIALPKLWIPFATEIIGSTNDYIYSSTYESCLKQYNHFKDPLNRIKKDCGSSTISTWWSASAGVGYSDGFCIIYSGSMMFSILATNRRSVPLCFRFA